MRHTATIELIDKIEVHDKLIFFNELKDAEALIYTDITSANKDEIITAYFSTEDNDKGRIIFENNRITTSVMLSFERLVGLNSFMNTHYGENVIDLVRKQNDPEYPPQPEPIVPDEPIITV